MAYSINIKKSVEKDLRKLPTSVISRVIEAIENLKDDPYPRQSKKLNPLRKHTGSELETIASFIRSMRREKR